jgi:hypothetical protein
LVVVVAAAAVVVVVAAAAYKRVVSFLGSAFEVYVVLGYVVLSRGD